jgi:hypothetical protein
MANATVVIAEIASHQHSGNYTKRRWDYTSQSP